MATDVEFDPNGEALTAAVSCGHAQAGAYILTVFEANNAVQEEKGTFFDPDDDSYQLSGSLAQQDGRLLQCWGTMELIAPVKQYALFLTISQGNEEVGSLTSEGETDDAQITRSLFARLVAKTPTP